MRYDKLNEKGEPNGIYLVVNDEITEGELEIWGSLLVFGQGLPALRGSFVRGGLRAGLVLEVSDPDLARLLEITAKDRSEAVIDEAIRTHRDPRIIQWYGAQLVILYNTLTSIDPN